LNLIQGECYYYPNTYESAIVTFAKFYSPYGSPPVRPLLDVVFTITLSDSSVVYSTIYATDPFPSDGAYAIWYSAYPCGGFQEPTVTNVTAKYLNNYNVMSCGYDSYGTYNYYFATQYLDCEQNSAPGGFVIRTILSPSSWICGATDDLQYEITGTATEGDYNVSPNKMNGDLLISSCGGTCA
jgi:hypothetical protein